MIRFQATGERHKVKGQYWDGMYWFYVTECDQRCLFMVIGKMQKEPTKVDCKVCF